MNPETQNYDVIIVGAGNAGFMVADKLSGSGIKALLLDANPEPLKQYNHIYGTFDEAVTRHSLKDAIVNTYDVFILQCPGYVIKKDWSSFPFRCIDSRIWSNRLKLDCEVLGGIRIDSAKRREGGIELTAQSGESFFGKMIVDCSGDVKVVSRLLGIKTCKAGYIDLSYTCTNCKITKPNEVLFLLDLRYWNIGAWWYSYNDNEGFLGLSDLNDLRDFSKEEMEKNTPPFIAANEPLASYLKDAAFKPELFKIGPPTKLNERITDDNFIAVGDAAGAGTTFCGEGFRVALDMGTWAGDAILSAFNKKDFSRRSFRSYEQAYQKNYGKYAKWGRLMTYVFVRAASNKATRELLESADKNWSPEDFYKFMRNEITPRLLFRLFSSKVFLLFSRNLILFYLGVPFSKE